MNVKGSVNINITNITYIDTNGTSVLITQNTIYAVLEMSEIGYRRYLIPEARKKEGMQEYGR